MPRPSPVRLGMLTAIAGMIGMARTADFDSTAEVFRAQRGKAPKGKRFVSKSVFMPGGVGRNVELTTVRNPKIAAQVNAMHDKWFAQRFPAQPLTPAA